MREIAGKTPGSVKVKVWRELEGFDPLADNVIDVEGTLKRIAMVYDLPVDTVADELELNELLPLYIDCVKHVNGIVLEKLKSVPKNADGVGN